MNSCFIWSVVLFLGFYLAAAKNHNDDHHKKRFHGLKHFWNRRSNSRSQAPENNQCATICLGSDSNNTSSSKDNFEGLEVVLKIEDNLFGLVNSTSNSGILFTININIAFVILLDTNEGNGAFLDIKSGTIYSIKNKEFSGPILNVTLLFEGKKAEDTWKIIKKGENSSITKPSNSSLDLLNKVSISLGITEEDKLTFSTLSNLQKFVSIIVQNLKTLLPSSTVKMPGDYKKFMLTLIGLEKLCDETKENSGSLKNIHLDLNYIFNSKSGPETLLRILTTVGNKTDLSKSFGKVLNNQDEFLQIIKLFGGNSNQGIDGLFKIIQDTISTIEGRMSPQEYIQNLFKIVIQGTLFFNPDELRKIIENFNELIISQDKMFNNSEALQPFVKFWNGLANHSLSINDVNISEIIDIIEKGDIKGGFKLIVHLVTKIIKSPNEIPRFINSIIGYLNYTVLNNDAIEKLFPGLNLSNFFGNGTFFENIMKNFNISSMIPSGGNPEEIMTKIPILGDLFKEIFNSFGGLNGFDLSSLNIFKIPSLQDLFGGMLGGNNGLFSSFWNSSLIPFPFPQGPGPVIFPKSKRSIEK